jgi:diphosphomevalonate decarboxylase
MRRATALAHPNIALAKYWGKREYGHNLPAVPSLSVTLAGMSTRTSVELDDALESDRLELDGVTMEGRAVERVSKLLDLVCEGSGQQGQRPRASVVSANDFPTAAGLASSASAFAALAVAANEALGAGLDASRLSCIARRVSASAGRSLFGGFVELPAGSEGDEQLPARRLAPADHWDVRLLVAVTTEDKKAIGSTEGMLHTARTSVFYAAWLQAAGEIYQRIRRAVLDRDMKTLGPAIEQSALAMHASAIAADPGIVYWNGATVETMHAVRRLRSEGLEGYFTIDAGPHVKVFAEAAAARDLEPLLAKVPGVRRIIVAEPGQGARREETEGR